jgi:hypothetical protein
MPVHKIGRKWSIGRGKARFKTKRSAERAYRAYLRRRGGKAKR